MTKARDHLTSTKPIKFNDTRIELEANGDFTLRQDTHVGGINFVKIFDASTTSSQEVVYTKLCSKDLYIVQ